MTGDGRGRAGGSEDDGGGPADGDFGSADPAADRLASALVNALAPRDLDEAVNDRLIAAAVERLRPTSAGFHESPHDEPAPLPGEVEVAQELGDLLQMSSSSLVLRTDETVRLAALARALRVAYSPQRLDDLRHEAILRTALKPRGRVRAALAVAGFVAAAAIVMMVVQMPGGPEAGGRKAQPTVLIPTRSAGDLFDPMQPFPRQGGTTERIDKIARARMQEGRENRFSRWGIP